MMVKNCAVPGCPATKERHRGLVFHRFPNNRVEKRNWEIFIRSGKKASVHARVCSRHFNENDYVQDTLQKRKLLKKHAVPTQNLPSRSHKKKEKDYGRGVRLRKRQTNLSNEVLSELQDGDPFIGAEEEIEEPSLTPDGHLEDTCSSYEKSQQVSVSSQTELSIGRSPLKCVEFMNSQQMSFHTGFSKHGFKLISEMVFDGEQSINCCLSPENQVFLTLYKYRHDPSYEMLGQEFDVDPKICSKVFKYVTLLLFDKLQGPNFWDNLVNRDEPYMCVIDCTEIPIVHSKIPSVQQVTYSSYKSRPTLKGLVGCNHIGLVMYVSELYGGSISDREIVKRSGFLELIQEDDLLLADKGFEISDLLEVKGAHVNIPPFKRNKQLSCSDVMRTRIIAQKRIIIECVIGLIKINKILVNRMDSCMWSLASQIFYNCSFLCNFKTPIRK